jgi:multidrug transporter EmrE-like cation transporter
LSPATAAARLNQPLSTRQAMGIVFLCTLIGATAQLLMKAGAASMSQPGIAGFLTNVPLMAGYACYALSTVMLIFALREGHLSILYPILALTYVWVTIATPLLFQERLNPFKILGVALVILGVGVLGRSGAGN